VVRIQRVAVRLPAVLVSCNNLMGKLFTPMYLCHQGVSIGTGETAMMPYGWEGNRGSGVALAMRHRLQWFIHLRTQRLNYDRKMSTPSMPPFYGYLLPS